MFLENVFFENVFFEGSILKMLNVWKSWKSSSEFLKTYFLSAPSVA